MLAKDELLKRIEYLGSAASLDALVDDGIAKSVHNGVANLLRKGLAIVAFNILEDYIKRRSSEALDYLSNSGIGFSKLTPSMQEAAIYGSLTSLVFRAKIEKKSDGDSWRSFVQEEALKIHSTGSHPFRISALSLASSGSNVSSSDVSDIMSAFGIKGGWTVITSVANAIGAGLPDASQTYKNAFERRHSSAHSAEFQYVHTWLQGLKDEILPLAAALDILLSARCRQVKANHAAEVGSHKIDDALAYQFLQECPAGYRESLQIGGKARKNWNELNTALVALRPKLEVDGRFLIVLNSAGRVRDWFTS